MKPSQYETRPHILARNDKPSTLPQNDSDSEESPLIFHELPTITAAVVTAQPAAAKVYDLTIIELKRFVVQSCQLIFKSLGSGHHEKVYQNALLRVLHDANIVALYELAVPFYYDNACVGWGYSDIVIQGRLVIELKQGKYSIGTPELAQCRKYMRALNIPEGMVINFPLAATIKCADVEVFDLGTGCNYLVGKLSAGDTERAESGVNGPAPQSIPQAIPFVCEPSVCEPKRQKVVD